MRSGRRLKSPTYGALLVAVTFDGASYSILAPVLPALRVRTGISNLAASLVFSAFYAGNLVGFMFGGYSVTRWGARRTILAGVLGQILGDVGIVLFAAPQAVAAARVLQGVASGLVWMGAVSAVMGGEEEGLGVRLGGVLSAYAVGAVGGPALGALGGVVRPFLAHLILEALAVGLLATSLPRERGRFAWGDVRSLLSGDVAFACTAAALGALILGMLDGSYSLRFSSRLSQLGLSAIYVTSTVCYGTSAVLAGTAGTLAGSWKLTQVGLVVAGGLVLAVSWASEPVAWFLLVACTGAAVGSVESATLGILSRTRNSGVVLGLAIYSQAWSVGHLVGPVLGTTLAEQGGWLVPGWVVLAASTLFAAGTVRGLGRVKDSDRPLR